MNGMKRAALALGVAAIALSGAWAGAASAKDVVVHAGRLIDGTGAAARDKVSILIHDDRITAIQPGFVTPQGAEIVDLSTKTVLPGLIDTHDHITAGWHMGDPIRNSVTRSDYEDAIEATGFVRDTLLAGFTAVRDCGANTAVIVALKKSIDGAVIPGPRLWVAGTPLGPTGGHGDAVNGLRTEFADIPHIADNIIDSPEAARIAVRRLKREGADLIKIMPSGGVMSIGDDPTHQLMTDEEIKAVIDTAHALGMKVAAHAHGKQAIDHTIALGVDSIEHGSYADAGSYKIFKQYGAYLVPTMLVGERVYQRAKEHPEQLNPSTAEKALVIGPLLQKNLRDAYAAGVKIAFGTDTFGLSRHGENAQEFALMVGAGMTPMDAIKAATGNAADLLGSQDVGTVQAGRYADLIAVDGDPLRDIRLLETVGFVMKGGAVVKAGGKPIT
ncbi:metal-dependent hydrolase family protein [Sphingobium sp. YR768]|uniref:metal-dependent hydrolase family protein n=1 Tax=Sphingobium sp. YR768 TaxID=1884365 RepID=UPI0008C631FE|nr:amidohydrolase family protein [Sphingobium sp. YR768]SEQ47046.1 Imidazolonepropionase [Sphingobium sp. YR768]